MMMRRHDREITDINEITRIIERCDVCRLAVSGEVFPYIVPLNFGYELDGTTLTLWFHSAAEGRKIELIKKNPAVCFEMDRTRELVRGKDACSWTMKYESVVGEGFISFVDNRDEKIRGLEAVMRKYAPGEVFEIAEAALDRVTVLKLIPQSLTAKRN